MQIINHKKFSFSLAENIKAHIHILVIFLPLGFWLSLVFAYYLTACRVHYNNALACLPPFYLFPRQISQQLKTFTAINQCAKVTPQILHITTQYRIQYNGPAPFSLCLNELVYIYTHPTSTYFIFLP